MLGTYRVLIIPLAASALLAGSLAAVPRQGPADFKTIATFSGFGEPVFAVAISPDSKLIATGSGDKTVKLCDPDTGKAIRTFTGPQGHQKPVLALAFTPDGKTLASAGEDGAVKIWEVATGKLVRTLAGNQPVHSLAVSPDGARLVTGSGDGKVRIWDLAKGTVLKEFGAPGKQIQAMIYAVAFHPTQDQVASAGYDGTVKVWDVAAGKPIYEFRHIRFFYLEAPGHRDSVYCLAFSPDGKYLATGSAGQECLLKIWDLADGDVKDLHNPHLKRAPGFEQSHPGWIYGVHWTTDGKHLVSAGVAPANKGYLAVWDAATAKMLHGEELPLGAFYALALMPDDRQALVGAGARGKTAKDLNKAYLIQLPP